MLNETVDNSTGQCTHNAYQTCNDHAEHVPQRDKCTDRSTDRPQSHRRPSLALDRCYHRTGSPRRSRDDPCGRNGARGELLLSSLFPRGALPARMLASRGTCRAHGCSYTEAAYELQAVLWTAAGRATGKQGQLAVGLCLNARGRHESHKVVTTLVAGCALYSRGGRGGMSLIRPRIVRRVPRGLHGTAMTWSSLSGTSQLRLRNRRFRGRYPQGR